VTPDERDLIEAAAGALEHLHRLAALLPAESDLGARSRRLAKELCARLRGALGLPAAGYDPRAAVERARVAVAEHGRAWAAGCRSAHPNGRGGGRRGPAAGPTPGGAACAVAIRAAPAVEAWRVEAAVVEVADGAGAGLPAAGLRERVKAALGICCIERRPVRG
jgi:hypothetical protein